MASNNVLYMKGMNIAESGDDDIWDDSKLKVAFDSAVFLVRGNVAKRVAMSTNSSYNKRHIIMEDQDLQWKPVPQWKTGMFCRAIYEEDGIEYEAIIDKIMNTQECVVKFVGYENSETVLLSSLKPSLGRKERAKQMEEALLDAEKYKELASEQKMDNAEGNASPLSSASAQNKKESGKNTNKRRTLSGFQLPEMPMPNFSHLHSFGSLDMDLPPPPPLLGMGAGVSRDSEDQAVSSMLISWYMSGYYTGLYQGMRRAKEGRMNHN